MADGQITTKMTLRAARSRSTDGLEWMQAETAREQEKRGRGRARDVGGAGWVEARDFNRMSRGMRERWQAGRLAEMENGHRHNGSSWQQHKITVV